MNLDIGSMVYSKAGRDKGKRFIVYEVVNNEHVKIVDGLLRKIEKPKKKKIKHIELTNVIIHDIKDKIVNKKRLKNSDIRNELEAH